MITFQYYRSFFVDFINLKSNWFGFEGLQTLLKCFEIFCNALYLVACFLGTFWYLFLKSSVLLLSMLLTFFFFFFFLGPNTFFLFLIPIKKGVRTDAVVVPSADADPSTWTDARPQGQSQGSHQGGWGHIKGGIPPPLQIAMWGPTFPTLACLASSWWWWVRLSSLPLYYRLAGK
jgi:hypothetical protein